MLGLSGEELERIKLTSPLLSKAAFDTVNAVPCEGGPVASQDVGLHCDLPQFLGWYELSSLDETRFQTPSDILVPLAAILAEDDEGSSSSNQNNCVAQPDSLTANGPPILHLELQKFPLAFLQVDHYRSSLRLCCQYCAVPRRFAPKYNSLLVNEVSPLASRSCRSATVVCGSPSC